jgi:hypothetical protein
MSGETCMDYGTICAGLPKANGKVLFPKEASAHDIRTVSNFHWNLALFKNEEIPRGRAGAAPERGYKSRIFTIHDDSVCQFGQPVRKWLFNGLKRDPRTRGSLIKEARTLDLAFPKGLVMDNRKVVSCDLTTASDLIPHDLASVC